MKTITNENKFVEMVVKNLVVGDKPSETIRIFAKYYFNKGFLKEEVKNKIVELLKSDKSLKFKIENWEVTIDRIINKVSKYESYKMKMIEVDKVNMTRSELDVINSLNDIKLEKLAFTLLIHCKVNNAMKNTDGNWVNSSVESISFDAKLSGGHKAQRPLRHDLLNRGLISAPRVGSLIVNFVDEESETIFIVNDFTDFINEYLKWKGLIKSIQCKCGRLVATTSNNRKYCDECIRMERNIQKKNARLRMNK